MSKLSKFLFGINFPTQLTVPWDTYFMDTMKSFYALTIRNELYRENVIMRYLK